MRVPIRRQSREAKASAGLTGMRERSGSAFRASLAAPSRTGAKMSLTVPDIWEPDELETEPANDAVVLTLPNEPRFLSLVRLVLSGLASQRDLRYEQSDDLQLAVETALADKSISSAEITLRIEPLEDRVAVSIHPVGNGSERADRILSTLVDSVATVALEDGEQWLRLEQHVSLDHEPR